MNNGFIATPSQVANVILTLCDNRREYKLNALKLVKLVYFVYAWYLAYEDENLFGEPIVVGVKGPIIQSLNGEFSQYGDDYIPENVFASTYNIETGKDDGKLDVDNQDKKIQTTLGIIEEVITYYKDKTGTQLSNITHEESAPWTLSSGVQMSVIDKALIKDRAKSKLKELGYLD
jgi:uncharacterized phage-associated protein